MGKRIDVHVLSTSSMSRDTGRGASKGIGRFFAASSACRRISLPIRPVYCTVSAGLRDSCTVGRFLNTRMLCLVMFNRSTSTVTPWAQHKYRPLTASHARCNISATFLTSSLDGTRTSMSSTEMCIHEIWKHERPFCRVDHVPEFANIFTITCLLHVRLLRPLNGSVSVTRLWHRN